MSIEDFIDWCVAKNISFQLGDAQQLKVNAAPGALTPDVVSELKARKPEIIQWLQAQSHHHILPRDNSAEPLPLSFSQQRLWLITQLEKDTSQYNMLKAFEITGRYRSEWIAQAFDCIIQRHEVLRSHYWQQDNDPVQVPADSSSFAVNVIDISGLSDADQEQQIAQIDQQEAHYNFDLSNDCLIRVTLICRADDRAMLLLNMHHIVSDTWSVGNIFNEFSILYRAISADQTPELPELSIQYGDFALWQRRQMQQGGLDSHIDFWKQTLADIPQVHNLPLDRPRPQEQGFTAGFHKRVMSAKLYQAAQGLAAKNGVTMFMLLQTVFALLIGKYSGEDDVVMGVPDAGRYRTELEPLIGFFVNTPVFRTRLPSAMSFHDLLQTSKQAILDVFAHREVPFDLLVEELKPQRELSFNPIFQIKFLFEGADDQDFQPIDGLTIKRVKALEDRVRFDLDLSVMEHKGGLFQSWAYKTELFDLDIIDGMSRSFEYLMEQIVHDPSQPLEALQLLNPSNRAKQLAMGQGQSQAISSDTSLLSLFTEQGLATPERDAITWQTDTQPNLHLSYAQLQTKVKRLVGLLHDFDCQPGDHIALYLPASPALLIAIFGVLQTGGVYIPLDPNNSKERLAHVLSDAQPTLVITEEQVLSDLPMAGHDLMEMDGWQDDDWLSEFDDTELTHRVQPQDSAYIIYTSGSTGKPKGVEISHRGLTDYLCFARQYYYREHLSGALLATSHAFDISVPSLFLPLITGGSVALSGNALALDELAQRLQVNEPTLLRMTPLHLEGVLALINEPCEAAHVFVIGGEALPLSSATLLQQRFPNSQIYNHYGPTEAVVGCCCFDVTANLDALRANARVPIGKAMDNQQLYVLNAQMQPVPQGVVGELYIGGAGLCKGYLNATPEQQACFVTHVEAQNGSNENAERLYKTGDLVRFNHHGDLEYIGRADNQIKLLGHRIELGEIEQQLLQLDAIENCAVILDDSTPNAVKLLALVVPADKQLLSESHLDGLLLPQVQTRLPRYMQPVHYVPVAALPRSDNGKLDRKQLQQYLGLANDKTVVPAETETQQTLVTIWSDLLGIAPQEIGITDTFFALGGQSLLAVKLVTQVRALLNVNISIRDVLTHPQLSALAEHIDAEHALAQMQQQQQHSTITMEGSL